MNAKGDIYVLEVNPLPGLTPDYSDLCLIAKAANIDYRSLIGEILSGGLKRLREKRRAEAAKSAHGRAGRRPRAASGAGQAPAAAAAGNSDGSNGASRDEGSGPGRGRQDPHHARRLVP